MVLGGFWYSPMAFGNMWMSLVGLDKKKMEGMKKEMDMKKTYAAAFVSTLVMALVFNVLVNLAGTDGDAKWSAYLGAIVWLGFVGTTTLNEVLWLKKPLKLYLLNNAHMLLSLVVMGLILGGWA
ncbi:DUF1761 domain-containing protein [Candidatus Woesearchaeota archaeon]|nr:DUF1761 domain-containing protein [Candidatus Woesearchaeota archaeon]